MTPVIDNNFINLSTQSSKSKFQLNILERHKITSQLFIISQLLLLCLCAFVADLIKKKKNSKNDLFIDGIFSYVQHAAVSRAHQWSTKKLFRTNRAVTLFWLMAFERRF